MSEELFETALVVAARDAATAESDRAGLGGCDESHPIRCIDFVVGDSLASALLAVRALAEEAQVRDDSCVVRERGRARVGLPLVADGFAPRAAEAKSLLR